MYLKQSDLFWGMSKEFVKEAMEMGMNLSRSRGDRLFSKGDDADRFYVLIKGSVLLQRGDTGPKVYMAKDTGQVIGWSSLIGRDTYSATATCQGETSLIAFAGKSFLEELENNVHDKAILFERVATMLGNRLLDLYPAIS